MPSSHSRRGAPVTTESQTVEHRVSSRLMREYHDYMRKASTVDKNFVKEVMGEQYMEKTARQRGLRPTVTPADKGHRGGHDADMRNVVDHQIRGESKAERSPMSKGQRNAEKSLVSDPRKSISGEGQFKKASGLDRAAAQATLRTLKNGGSVSREINRTTATENGFKTTVKTRTYAFAETGTQGGPVTKTFDPSVKTAGLAKPGRVIIPLKQSAIRPVASREAFRSVGSAKPAGGVSTGIGRISKGPSGKL